MEMEQVVYKVAESMLACPCPYSDRPLEAAANSAQAEILLHFGSLAGRMRCLVGRMRGLAGRLRDLAGCKNRLAGCPGRVQLKSLRMCPCLVHAGRNKWLAGCKQCYQMLFLLPDARN